jgi:hypothetical protein
MEEHSAKPKANSRSYFFSVRYTSETVPAEDDSLRARGRGYSLKHVEQHAGRPCAVGNKTNQAVVGAECHEVITKRPSPKLPNKRENL